LKKRLDWKIELRLSLIRDCVIKRRKERGVKKREGGQLRSSVDEIANNSIGLKS